MQLSFAEHSLEMPALEAYFDLIERIDVSDGELSIQVKAQAGRPLRFEHPFSIAGAVSKPGWCLATPRPEHQTSF